ncbi:MAG: DoxX family protein [Gemmatimonadota bacterium]|nr:DoxX family protein [Gemmatimonadota bacterium]
MNTTMTDPATLGIGLLVARLALGLLMAAHGSQKLFGWFGGHGLAGTAGFFDSIGFRPGRFFATTAAATEVGSGILMALGFLGPLGPALMLSVMIVAAVSMHWKNGLFAMNNGIEVPLLYAIGAFGLLFTGPGAYSMDAVLGLGFLSTPMIMVWALVIAVAGGVMNLMARQSVTA